MRSAWLRGQDHTELGEVASRAEGAAAIALSIGGARKAYSHTDPNEDAAGYAVGDGGVVLAVADGHGGREASEAELEHVIERWAAPWTARDARLRGSWQIEALTALASTNEAILKRAAAGGRRLSRTTLAFAVVRPAEGFLFYASIGDSHVYRVRRDVALDLAAEISPSGGWFVLGHEPETVETLREKCVIGAETLSDVRVVALVTDGISERGVGVDDPAAAVLEAARDAAAQPLAERPSGTARAIVQAALDAHRRQPSGDNVAAAVAWLGP